METGRLNPNPDPEWTNYVQDDVAQKRAATRLIARRRTVSRTYGIVALVEGCVGLLLSVGLQFWVGDIMVERTAIYGQTVYMPVYDVESIGLALISAACFLTIIAGIGFIKRERWAVYGTHICGIIIFVISVSAILIRNYLLRSIDPSIPLSIPGLSIKLAIALAVALPLIIPPILPPIFNATEPKRRHKYARPHIG